MRRTCTACDLSWPSSALWCGQCGQPLEDPVIQRTGNDGAVGSARPRLFAVLLLAVAVIVLIGLGLASGGFGIAEDALASLRPSGGRVELPAAEDAEVRARGDGALRCEPAGCERWRVEVAGASAPHVREGTVYLVQQHGLVAIDRDEGTVRWGAALSQVRGRDHAGIHEVGDDLVLVSSRGLFQAVDRRTGTWRWEAEWTPDPAFQAQQVDGVVLVSGFLAPEPGPGTAPEDDPGGERADRSALSIRAYDTATGEVRWERHGVQPAGREVALIRADGHLRRLDALTGEDLWARPVEAAWGQQDPTRVVVTEGDDIVVIDARTGETIAAVPNPAGPSDPDAVHEVTAQTAGPFLQVQYEQPQVGSWQAELHHVERGELVASWERAFWPSQVNGLWIVGWSDDEQTWLEAFDLTTGDQRWRSSVSDEPHQWASVTPAASGDLIAELWGRGGPTRAIMDADTGKVLDHHRVDRTNQDPFLGGIEVEHEGNSTRLAGPGGFAVFSQRVEPTVHGGFLHDAVFVRQRGGPLIRVNEEMLLGDWLPAPPAVPPS